LLRENLLVESTCTLCGDPNAYIGMNSCECPNPKCRFFSQHQADDIAATQKIKSDDDDGGYVRMPIPSFNDAWKFTNEIFQDGTGGMHPHFEDMCQSFIDDLEEKGEDTWVVDELEQKVRDVQEGWEAYDTGGIDALSDVGPYAAPEQIEDEALEALEAVYKAMGLPTNVRH